MTVEREEELFTGYANGRLTDAEQAELKTQLGSYPAAAERFAAFVEETTLFIQVADELTAPAGNAEPTVPTIARRPMPLVPWAIAAAAAIIAAVLFLNRDNAPMVTVNQEPIDLPTIDLEKPSTAPSLPVTFESVVTARLDGSMDAWMEGSDSMESATGSWQTTEEPMELAAGAISITLESGVSVTVEGPASFRVAGADRVELKFGRLYAEVPTGMAGFVVESPAGTVVDLGTRFGFGVRKDRSGTLHVFEGIVEFWPPDNDSSWLQRLRAGEAVAIDPDGNTSPEPFGSERFLHIPDQKPEPSFVKWNCDSDGSGRLYSLGLPIDLQPSGPPPKQTKGKFGGAVRFDVDSAPLRAKWDGIVGTKTRTVACWIRIPPANTENSPVVLASWGAPEADAGWQLTWNDDAQKGTAGALVTSTGQSAICGTTDLRDGRWHHVSSVLIGGDDANLATHVRHYVDGKLDGVSFATPHAVNTRPGGFQMGLRSGKTATSAIVEIDELIILDTAPSAAEVHALMADPSVNKVGN